MGWFDNLSLRAKSLVNFIVSGGVLVAAIVFCIVQINAVGRDTNALAKNWLPSVQVAVGKSASCDCATGYAAWNTC